MSRVEEAPIFLIGYRGTGKTTVARELATRLGQDWVDADDVVEARADKSIAQIFAGGDEQEFRDLEAGVVAELCKRSSGVVALGGGAILRDANRRAIVDAGAPVVWLQAAVDTILARVQSDPTTSGRRPGLTTAGGRAEIETLLAQRTPLYRECATLIVDTEGKTASQVAEEIARQI